MRRTHTAIPTVSTIEDLPSEGIPLPPYSTEVALSDFRVFGPLKGALGESKFRDHDEVGSAVHE